MYLEELRKVDASFLNSSNILREETEKVYKVTITWLKTKAMSPHCLVKYKGAPLYPPRQCVHIASVFGLVNWIKPTCNLYTKFIPTLWKLNVNSYQFILFNEKGSCFSWIYNAAWCYGDIKLIEAHQLNWWHNYGIIWCVNGEIQ